MTDYFSGTASQERQRWACRDSKTPIGDSMDLLRLLEYPQLLSKTYLDHAGTTPWAKSLTTDFAQMMTEDLFGNPHSESDPSKLSDQKIEATRRKALEFFNCDPDDWDLVFTANSTAAIKLVHDCFRDHAAEAGRNWWYGYHKDAHTSLVGVREGTRMHRCFRSDNEVEKWIDFRGLGGAVSPHDVQLFAYPAQSNMTGKRFPLEWPGRVRDRVRGEVYTLLDAAAYASTAQLDLSNAVEAPDFVALSFYKIFGFPNLGALIVRKASSKILESRKFFGGGTIEMVISINDNWVSKKKTLHSRLEDGTLPFTSIFALDLAVDTHRKLYGPAPMKYISMHTCRLTKKLHDQLVALRHSNGVPLVQVHTDHDRKKAAYGKSLFQGAIVAFSVLKSVGGFVSFLEVEQEANKQGIYVRSGSLCNPGGLATHLHWSPTELHEAYDYGHRCSDPQAGFKGKPIGVVRASLGAMSNEDDVENLVRFIKQTYMDREYASGGRIVLPDLVQKPGTPNSLDIQSQKEVSGAVLRVTDQDIQDIQDCTPHALKQIGMMPPPTIEEINTDNESLRQKSRKSFSMRSGGSRFRAKFRRSIIQVLHPKVTAQHYG